MSESVNGTRHEWLDGGILKLQTPLVCLEGYRWDGLRIEKGRKLVLRIKWIDETNNQINLSSGYTAAWTFQYTNGGSALLSLTQASAIALSAGGAGANIVATISAAASAAITWDRAYHSLVVTHALTGMAQRLTYGSALAY